MFFKQISVLLLWLLLGEFAHCQSVQQHGLVPKAILGANYKTVLYKAGIDIYKNHYSGIFYFQKDSFDHFRIVFLSEFGLNLLDLNYVSGDFIINSCKEFLNKKRILESLTNDLDMLLRSFPDAMRVIENKPKGNCSRSVSFRYKANNYSYFYNQQQNIEKIKISKGCMYKVKLLLSGYGIGLPSKIEIFHKPVKLKLVLTKIQQG